MENLEKIRFFYRDDKVSYQIILCFKDDRFFDDLLYSHLYVEAFFAKWNLSAEEFYDKLED